MKKVFVICPWIDRDKEKVLDTQIKMRDIASVVFGEELELANPIIKYYRKVYTDRMDIPCELELCVKMLEMAIDADYIVGMDIYGIDMDRDHLRIMEAMDEMVRHIKNEKFNFEYGNNKNYIRIDCNMVKNIMEDFIKPREYVAVCEPLVRYDEVPSSK